MIAQGLGTQFSREVLGLIPSTVQKMLTQMHTHAVPMSKVYT